MNTPRIVKSKVKCKCGSTDLYLTEIWKGHSIEFDQDGGQFDANNTVQEMGDPYKVEAKCKTCKRHWTLRGISQIYDIQKD